MGGKPIVDQPVLLNWEWKWMEHDPQKPGYREVITDKSGEFVIKEVPRFFVAFTISSTPGDGPVRGINVIKMLTLPAFGDYHFDLDWPAGGAIAGRILDTTRNLKEEKLPISIQRRKPADGSVVWRLSKTYNTGEFTFEDIPPGSYELAFETGIIKNIEVASGTTQKLELALTGGASLEIEVTEGRYSVSRAIVTLLPTSARNEKSVNTFAYQRKTTTSSGTATITHIVPGTYFVRAECNNQIIDSSDLDLKSDSTSQTTIAFPKK